MKTMVACFGVFAFYAEFKLLVCAGPDDHASVSKTATKDDALEACCVENCYTRMNAKSLKCPKDTETKRMFGGQCHCTSVRELISVLPGVS